MKTQKQRIFSFLVLLTMVIVLTCIFAACDKGGAQDKNYTVTIHPDNGQADFVWDTKTDIPVITKYGYHIGGFYLDEDMTISTTLESLKATNLTADLNVYVKWEKDSVPPKTKIVTKNLLCDYDTRALSGKVSNSTTVFSFYDEISVEKGTTYTISTDINGINVIPSKTVNLEIGDNIFYVLVSNEDELTLYTATVRRKPIYTVTFDTLGGTEVEAQQVEEDAFATAPTTEKNGCTFEKWNWDFSMPITENTTITAIWNAFVYNIVYDFNIPEDSASQEVDNSMNPTTYTVDDTIYFSAPRRKGYYFTGWSVSNISKGTTGTITTTARWRLIPYEIIYDFGDSNSVSKATNNDSNPRYYCVENEINFAEPTRDGYTFVSWDKNIEKGTTGTQTVTASWDVNQYNIEYVLNGWTNAENNKTIYTIEDKTFALSDGMNGGSLFCGWYLDNEYTNCIETIDASTMRDYKVYAMPDCGATKGLTIENGVVKGYSGASNEVIIPSFYKGYAVDSLVESAFKDRSLITSVTVPNSVTKIETGSFFGCSSLESISIPFVGASNTAQKGYDQVLGYIFGYKEITGPFSMVIGGDVIEQYVKSSNKEYVHYAYYIPKSLKNVVISGEMTMIPDNAFKNCAMLTSITIPDSVTVIRYEAFQYCRMLRNITIPDNVTVICKDAFNGCIGLTNIVLGDGVTNIGENAFNGCEKLVEVHNKSSLPLTLGSSDNGYIAYYAKNVYSEDGKSKLSVDSNGYEIYADGDSKILIAYYGSETDLILPIDITVINKYALYDCNRLTSLIISDNVISIGDYAFSDCVGMITITMGNNIASIGNQAFRGCSLLTNIAIPNSVTSIGDYAFSSCYNLQNIYITDIAAWCNISGLGNLMDYSLSDKKLYLNNALVTSITIPDSVTLIPDHAFCGCSSLADIAIPDSVMSIGDYAFYGCSGLASITIPDSVTSIGGSAFYGCSGLTSVTIGNGVTSIGGSAFSGCEKLTSVTIPNGVTSIDWYAFNGCDELTSITIPNSLTSIGWYAFEGCTNLTNIYYNGDVAGWCSILGLANLMNCGSDSLWGWNSCEKKLHINNELVTSLVIPDGVTNIGSSAFQNCSNLTSVTIPNSVTNIGASAFSGCSKLESITIPNSVTSIGSSAFKKCSSLTIVTISVGLTSIGTDAFSGCQRMTIHYNGTRSQWASISKGANWNFGAVNCPIHCSDGTI